ncbi:uncharacterized protein LOC143914706 [Arctopsyche grandis]|uniref:uncharacterized protein LOC143914706 n=1 Tax=Arctopsyche grandis TaxID=121162 RepID=UPI00406D7B07
MLTRSKVAFVYVFIAEILNCATEDSGVLHSSHPSWSEHPWELHPFLEEQYYNSVQLLRRHYQNEENGAKRTQRSLYGETLEIFVESITPYHLSKNTRVPVSILNVNGERQILLEDNIFRVHEHENGNLFVEPEYILNILDPVLLTEARKAPKSFSIKIIFSKYNRNAEIRGTAEYNNDTVILMGYRNYSQVYILPHTAKGKWDKSKLKQTFSSESNKPKAAKFVQHNNQLYLYTCRIYLWTGTHFDELFILDTENANDLAVIKKHAHFILIVSQNPHDGNVGSQLYKFIPQYGVFKIHAIHSHDSGKLLTYEDFDFGEMYSIFINKQAKSNIFRLVDGEELIASLATFDFQKVVAQKVAIVEGKSIIFLGTDNQIMIYIPDGESLRKIYNMNFHGVTKILGIEYIKIKNTGSNILLVLTKSESSIDVQIVKFGLIRDNIVSETESDSPFQCLYDIEAILDERQVVLDDIASKVEKIMTRNGALVDGVLKVTQDVKLINSKVDSIKITSDEELLVDTRTLIDTAGKVNDAITKLEEGVSHVILKEGPVEIKGTLEIKGDLTMENLSAVKLNVGTVNGKPFVGDAFLFNNETQHLRGESFVGKTINVKKLTSPLFNSFLSTASVFQSLAAENIVLVNRKAINDIELDSIVLKGYEGTIMGTKTFDRLTTYEADTERLGKELLTPWIQRSLNNEIPVKNLVVDNNLTVSHLFAKRINGINVTELMDSIYQRGIHGGIEGDITFLSNLNVTSLHTDLMENSKVEEFMTKTTEQTVTSTIKIDRLLSKTINAKSINTLKLNDDVAIIGRKNVVKSPTTVFDLDVAKDLRLNCGSQNQSFCNIIPTKPEDLLQMYNGPVTIVGTLTVPELRFTKHARMKIDEIPFHTEIESLFWMTDKSQVITSDVTFSKGISVPQISAEVVNDQPIEKIYSTVNDRRNVSLLLKHVQVNNDVIVPENTQCSLIKEIDRTAVKKIGTYHITGKKTFTDTVTVDNLNTEYMNNLNMNEIVLKNNENTKFHGNMNFKTLRIHGDMVVNTNFDSYSINGFNLPSIYERAAKINEPAVLENVQFLNKINVENLQVRQGVLANIGNILQDTFKNIHVYVEGDVHVRNANNVRLVNDVYFNDYMNKVVLKDQECEIRGSKYFKGDLVVEEDFYADVVNGSPFGKLFAEALTVSGYQEISGKHTIQNFIAPSIEIDSINGIRADEMIDVTAEDDLYIDGDVRFEHLSVTGDLFGELERSLCEEA